MRDGFTTNVPLAKSKEALGRLLEADMHLHHIFCVIGIHATPHIPVPDHVNFALLTSCLAEKRSESAYAGLERMAASTGMLR